MRHRHPQDRQLVRLPGEGTAGRDHVRELRDVGGHFVSPPPLDLAVVFSTAKWGTVKSTIEEENCRGKEREEEEGVTKQNNWCEIVRCDECGKFLENFTKFSPGFPCGARSVLRLC